VDVADTVILAVHVHVNHTVIVIGSPLTIRGRPPRQAEMHGAWPLALCD
jgi:hypothetical protein